MFRRVLNQEYAAELWHSQLKLAEKGYGAFPAFASPGLAVAVNNGSEQLD
jgi:hypothetical protein